MKMWSGRFTQGQDADFEQWQRSFPFDRKLLKHELAASAAYSQALRRAGVLSAEEDAAIRISLAALGAEAKANPALLDDREAEDVHHFVEKQLVARVGDLGLKLHSGRSRNEQIATDLRLYVREQGAQIRSLLRELSLVLLQRAEEAGEAVLPAYTHLQRAEPVLLAHMLLAYVEMFERDAARIEDCAKRAEECPLGSGAITGSTIALDREALARELGFARPSANSMDATSERDFALEFVSALTQTCIHLSGWAEQFILFATQEFAFIQLPESFSTGSSAMPHKKNPDALELVRAKAAPLLGCYTTLGAGMKALPLAYNKDLQETQQPLFTAAEEASACVRIAAGFMREVQFDAARMREAAAQSFTNAFAAATYLVTKGVPFRTAHERIGHAVRVAIGKKCRLEDLKLAELRALSPEFGEDFYVAVSLERVLRLHNVAGGTAPERVRAALKAARARLAPLQEAHAEGA